MRDIDVRQSLRKDLVAIHGDDPDTLILDELGLCEGRTRVDLAVINGEIIGYEIKSERDTLARLPVQMEIYNRTLDRAIIVVGHNHLSAVQELVPHWWGIQEAVEVDGDVQLLAHRDPSLNPDIDPFSLVQLLWRNEALQLLEELGLDNGLRSKPRRDLWYVLAENMPLDELRSAVRHCLKSRVFWRSDRRPRQNDG